MTAEVINIWDYKRKEERQADLVRFASEVMSQIDTAPCEMPPAYPSYQAPEQDPA
jgi:hypothetical protein